MDGRCPALRTKWDVHRRRRSISLRYVVFGMILSRDPGPSLPKSVAIRVEAILNKLVGSYPDFLVSHDNDTLTWKAVR